MTPLSLLVMCFVLSIVVASSLGDRTSSPCKSFENPILISDVGQSLAGV